MLELISITLIKIIILCAGLMTAAAYFVLLERRIAAWVQDRRGPNRVGIPLTRIKLFGLGQPLADGLKFIFKEEFTPAQVDKVMYTLAPISILTTALAIFAVIPFGDVLPLWGEKPIELVVVPNFDAGVIYIFALSSLAVYGVLLGGWASNNKYSLLGGMRSTAQLIAYELPLSLGLLGVVLAVGSLRLETIIGAQASSGWWFAVTQPLGLIVFLIASYAEAARLPFDLPEAEQELIGGYHTEYSSIRLLMYLVAEFLHMITASFLIVILFFGGWSLWGLTSPGFWGVEGEAIPLWLGIVRIGVLMSKIVLVILFFMLSRWTWPRFRFDQLMALAWKVMLPLGIANLIIVAVLAEYRAPLVERLGEGGVIALTWSLSILAMLLAAVLIPLHSGNRKQLSSPDLFGLP